MVKYEHSIDKTAFTSAANYARLADIEMQKENPEISAPVRQISH